MKEKEIYLSHLRLFVYFRTNDVKQLISEFPLFYDLRLGNAE